MESFTISWDYHPHPYPSVLAFTLPISRGEKRDSQFRPILDREFRRAQENLSPLTLFLMEVEEGTGRKDAFAEEIEKQMKKCLCRKSDILLRREREKPWVAIYETGRKRAEVIYQRTKENLRKIPPAGLLFPLVLKIGAASYPDEGLSGKLDRLDGTQFINLIAGGNRGQGSEGSNQRC